MRCGIDVREIQNGVYTGIGRALSLFLQHIDSFDPEGRHLLFSSKPLPLSFGETCENIVVPERLTILWDQLALASLCRKHSVELFYSPYYKYPLWWKGPVVCTVMDLMFLDYGPYRKRLSCSAAFYYSLIAAAMVRRATATVTCSEYSKAQIQRLFRVPGDRIHVIPLGLDSRYQQAADPGAIARILQRYAISSGEYLLYSGNFKPHKNIATLLGAFAIALEKHPELKLVLMGNPCANSAEIHAHIAQSGSGNNVVITGPVCDQDQVALYCAARALIMPSAYEGFGYPPLEAMACGTPVICTNATSLPEIVGDAALMVRPDCDGEMADAILKLIASPHLATELKEKGLARSGQFDSHTYAARLFNLLNMHASRNNGNLKG